MNREKGPISDPLSAVGHREAARLGIIGEEYVTGVLCFGASLFKKIFFLVKIFRNVVYRGLDFFP